MPGETPGITPEELIVHPEDYKNPNSNLTKEEAAILAGAVKDPELASTKAYAEQETLKASGHEIFAKNGEPTAMTEAVVQDTVMADEFRNRVGESVPNATDETKEELAKVAARSFYDTRKELIADKRAAEESDEQAAQEILEKLKGLN